MVMTPATVHVDVWSDIACPWCYVGKTRLDQAIQNVEMTQAKERPVKIEVTWHAYMIDPRTNPMGEEYMAYNVRRWGSDSWTTPLRRSGAKSGIKFANWQWWPNTFNAHRLIQLAKEAGKGSEAKSALLRLTYEGGENVSDMEVLCAAAEELGLEGAREYLESERGKRQVSEDDRRAKQELQVHGVPYFLLDNRLYFSGAQDVETFEKALTKALGAKQQQQQQQQQQLDT